MGKRKKIVLYHKNCPDGYGAAVALYRKFKLKDIKYDEKEDILFDEDKNVFFIPSNHDTELKRLRSILENNKNDKFEIYLVDFYTDKILDIASNPQIEKIYIYDHHKTAKERWEKGIPENLKNKIEFHYDENKSGATLTWEKVFGYVPKVMKYIEDRDIWKWSIKDSDKVLTALDTEIFNIKLPDEIFKELNELADEFHEEKYKEHGKIMLDFKKAIIFKICSSVHYLMLPKGDKLYAVNSPVFRSEIGDVLSEVLNNVIAIYSVYPTENGNFLLVSLRSKNGKAKEIAEKYGGGGHPNAAGFRVPIKDVDFGYIDNEEKIDIVKKLRELLFK